ncbi:MAG: type II secretion system F family protein [Deltaproteobacteria bacterium]|nr:type II secretion system F family protein [Deltaproteobacteria bacterium]MCB9785516.1 type II secretion system F family protein [Deltaproteobacteria bacterium]
MALYQWEGKDRSGEMKRGVLDAPSEMEVQNQLRSMGLEPVKIKKKVGGGGIIIPGITKVPIKSKVIFTRQLATMIDAGLPLVQCLEILGGQEPNPLFQKVILDVKRSVESGGTFADSLAKHPKIFDNLFVNLISAGEMGGILDTILNRLAAYIEKSVKLKQKVKSAMKYPMTVLFVSLGISGFLLVKVIPTFGEMFKSMGKELPPLTQTVMNVSKTTVDNLPLIVGILIVLFIAMTIILKNDKPRYYFDAFMLKVPVFGTLLKKAAVAKFTRTLGTLISSGVPILDALEIVAKTAGNKVVEKGVMYTREKISEGKSIASPLMEQPVFPKMVVQMIAVGESTGAMDIMLSKIADFYDDEVDAAVDGITSLIEPLIMVVLGGIIGVVLLAMYMPIFNMADSFS